MQKNTECFARASGLGNLPRQMRDHDLGVTDTNLEHHLALNSLSHLPQSTLLRQVLSAVKNDGLAEAYLRGSFSTGEADDYSDIDLFLVVDPTHLEKTFLMFLSYAQKHHKVLSICHDKLVADYGGIGFMALLKNTNTGRVTQFDLYFCQTGGHPTIPLINSTRIYSRNQGYSIFCEPERQMRAVDANSLMAHVSYPLDPKTENAKHELNDLLIAAFIMSKHLKRGQFARARNDDHHAVQVCASLLKDSVGYVSHQTPLYFADRLAATCKTSGTPAQQKLGTILERMCAASPSSTQINNIIEFSREIIGSFFHDLRTEFEPILHELETLENPTVENKNVFPLQPAPSIRAMERKIS